MGADDDALPCLCLFWGGQLAHAERLKMRNHMAVVDDRTERGDASSRLDCFLDQLDRTADNVEPALTILLTVAVGASLVAAMLPLVGILQSIG